MKQTPPKNKTPQKYGHASRILPIRKRIWQKVLIRWAIVLAIGIALVLLCVISQPFYRKVSDFNLGISLTVVVYAFIIWQSHVLKLTFSKEWTGIVTKREVKKYTKIPQGLASFGPDAGKQLRTLSIACTWTVERDDGYTEMITYDTEEIWEGYFEIGERVRLYKNAKIIVKAHPPRGEENLMCPLCGVMIAEPICRKCGVDFTEREES